MRRETTDARKIGARRETIDGSHASRLTPRRVSGLTSRAQWPITRLGEVTVIKRGKYITRNSVRPGNVPVILGGQEPAYYCDEANHAGPCIVISRSGASAGFVSYWDQPIFVTDGFLFEANEKSNIRYLYYCLKANQSLLGHMQNGTGIPHVRGEELKTFEIPLPPLPVQRRIADILSAYDDLIENNRRRIAILEETARLTYRKWFGGEDRSNEWEVHKVSEVLESFPRPKRVPKESYITDGAYPCIDQGKDFIGGYTNDEEAIVRRLPAIVFGDHTRVLKYVSEPFACGADGTQLLYAKDGVLTQSYLYCALKEIDLTNYFYARHFKILKSKEVFVPPYSIVKQFTDEVSCNLELISVLRKHGVKLAAARDMLLPRLMKGEVA